MKKSVTMILAVVLALNLVGCSSSGSSGKSADASGDAATVEENAMTQENADAPEVGSGDSDKAKDSDGPQWEVGKGRVTTWEDSIGSTWAQIIVPVTNTGDADLYLSSGSMDLEDETGHLVDSKTLVSVYPEVLKPGETAYYYEETTLEEGGGSALSVVPHIKAEKAKVECKRFELSDLELKNEQYGGVALTGRVENTSDNAESMIYVAGFLYDANHEMIATLFTILSDELAPGEKIGFSASTFSVPDSVTAEAVDHYEVYAYPLQFQL